jgi:hypothetical protein
MNTEAHLAFGWLLAHIAGAENRRFRAIVTLAAVAPDIDTVTFFFGERAYANYHHALGHNIFIFTLFSIAAMLLYPRRLWTMLLLTQIALYSHYFGDYFLTRFPLEFFWPIPHKPFLFGHKIGLDHPINNALSYLSFVLFIVMGVIYKRSPVELVSPNLDQRIVNLFRHKPLSCHICGGKANEHCESCGEPVCLRHGRLNRRCLVTCAACHARRKKAPADAMAEARTD